MVENNEYNCYVEEEHVSYGRIFSKKKSGWSLYEFEFPMNEKITLSFFYSSMFGIMPDIILIKNQKTFSNKYLTDKQREKIEPVLKELIVIEKMRK